MSSSRRTSGMTDEDMESTDRDETGRAEASSRRGGRSVEEALKMISTKRINQYLLKNWTEILLVPLIPSVLSLITILFGTIILNTAQLECVQPLGSFLAADVVFAYLILLGYTWLLIGPIPVQSLLNTALAMFFLGMVLFFFYIVGSGLLSASSPCADTAPVLYRFTQFKVACFWIGFLVAIGYMAKHLYRWKTKSQRQHAERVLDNERKVARMQEDEEDD